MDYLHIKSTPSLNKYTYSFSISSFSSYNSLTLLIIFYLTILLAFSSSAPCIVSQLPFHKFRLKYNKLRTVPAAIKMLLTFCLMIIIITYALCYSPIFTKPSLEDMIPSNLSLFYPNLLYYLIKCWVIVSHPTWWHIPTPQRAILLHTFLICSISCSKFAMHPPKLFAPLYMFSLKVSCCALNAVHPWLCLTIPSWAKKIIRIFIKQIFLLAVILPSIYWQQRQLLLGLYLV